jgi:hypothetical protein
MSLLTRIKLQQLKDKCKELKIKDYGTKITIVKRFEQHYLAQNLGVFILEEYVKELEESIVGSDVESDESLVESEEIDVSSQASKSSNVQPMTVDDIIINEEDEDEDGQATSTAKKGKVTVKPIYIVHETFENAILAIEFIQNEGIWNNYCISNKTKDGTKSYYGCKNKGCAKKIGLWYDLVNETTKIAKSANIEHDHTAVQSTLFGMNETTKLAIEHVFVMGTKTAQSIKYALRNPLVLEKLPATIDTNLILDYDLKQIENFLFHTLKPKLLNKSSFNYGELFEWVKSHEIINR